MAESEKSAFMRLARARFEQGRTTESKQRERERSDLRFYAAQEPSDQWGDAAASRAGVQASGNMAAVPARPCLTINMIRDPVRHVLSDEQQADLGITLTPADDFGQLTGPLDDTEIELREGLVRRIQRESGARDARSWAFQRAVICGRGYYGITTEFAPGKSFDQFVRVFRFYNQATVVLDPTHEEADGSDAGWGFYGTDMSWDVYKSEHPDRDSGGSKNQPVSDDDEWRALGEEAPDWFNTEGEGDKKIRSVRVMNYFYAERKTRQLLQLADGSVHWADELATMPDKAQIANKRQHVLRSVKWAKIDGAQVLDETDWPGQFIPIVKVLAEELQPYDQERRVQGMVRPARDAQHGFNVTASTEVEVALLQPRTPVAGAAGQFEGFEAAWDQANVRNIARLEYNIKTDQTPPGVLLPPPSRLNVEAPIATWDPLRQMFAQAIKSTTGIPDPTLGNVDPSLRSGRAIRELVESAKRGTSGYMSNLVKSVTHEARIINDLLFPIYGQRPGRLVQMMTGKHESQSVMVGQPFVRDQKERPIAFDQAQHGNQQPEQFKLTKDANFNVAIRVSKDFDTQRQEEASTLGELIGASPELLTWFGDLYFENQDGPGHKDMAERAKLMLAPPIQESLRKGKQGQIPPEVQAQMAGMQQQMQQLQQLADKNLADLKKAELDAESKERIAAAEIESKERTAALDREVKITVAELGAKVDRMGLFMEERMRVGAQSVDVTHEALQSQADRDHEREMGERAHAQTMQQADQGQQHALEAGEQGQAHALEQGQQAADLAPQPEAGS